MLKNRLKKNLPLVASAVAASLLGLTTFTSTAEAASLDSDDTVCVTGKFTRSNGFWVREFVIVDSAYIDDGGACGDFHFVFAEYEGGVPTYSSLPFGNYTGNDTSLYDNITQSIDLDSDCVEETSDGYEVNPNYDAPPGNWCVDFEMGNA